MNKAYFTNGILCAIQPYSNDLYEHRDVAYHADSIVCEGIEYSLHNPDDIKKIPIPDRIELTDDSVFDISYILKIRLGYEENIDVVTALIPKVLDLMAVSRLLWRRRDFLQVIRNFYRNGLFEEGDHFESEYRKSHRSLLRDPGANKAELEHQSTKAYFYKKWYRKQEYIELCKILPDAAPKTLRGFLQMRTRKTAHFMKLKALAEEQGLVIGKDRILPEPNKLTMFLRIHT